MTARNRNATPADLPVLVAIDTAATPLPWSRGQLAGSLANHCVLIREEGGEAVGFLIFNRVLDEAELFNVVVDPAHQGRGHASALLAHLIAANSGHARRILLEVRASNQRAIDLYQYHGFVRQGTRKRYYPPLPTATSREHEDAWVMAYGY